MKHMVPPIMQNTIPLDQIIPHPRNFRHHPESQLKQLEASYERFGQFRSIVVQAQQTGPYLLVAGHGITEAMRRKKAKEARCDVLPSNMPEADVDAIMIADNLLPLQAVDDEELLARLLQEQQEAGYDLAALGSDEETLRQMLANLGEETSGYSDGAGGDDFDTIPEEGPTRSQVGQLWRLGEHRLLVGDCTNHENVKELLQSDKVTLMVTDPPYGIDYDPEWRKQVRGEANTPTSIGKVTNDGRIDWTDAYKLSQADVAYVWHACFHSGEVAEGLRASGFEIRSQIVWVKSIFALSRSDYHWKHETCWYAVRKGVTRKWNGDRDKTTVWEVPPLHSYSSLDEHTGHGTQKPIKLFISPIENNTDPGDIVYDPFAGSGTAIIACERTGRIARCCELEPKYADICLKRWEAETGQTAELLERVEVPT